MHNTYLQNIKIAEQYVGFSYVNISNMMGQYTLAFTYMPRLQSDMIKI